MTFFRKVPQFGYLLKGGPLKTKTFLIVSILMFLTIPVHAQEDGVAFEFYLGSAYSLPTGIIIRQDGYPNITITNADYATKPFSDALYYSIRVGQWKNKTAWEFEFVHHKLYLENKPPEVQKFNITHGYNLIYLNRTLRPRKITEKLIVVPRIGFGPVVTHPETIIRGMEFEDIGGLNRGKWKGFYFSGFTGQLTYQFRYNFHPMFFAAGELKFTGAYANIKIAQGNATVPNFAVHGTFGVGVVLP